MKVFVSMIMLYSLSACAHSPTPVSATTPSGNKFFTFQIVSVPVERSVATDKKSKTTKATKKPADQKFVAVYTCEKGATCAETDANKKMVPYDQFVSQVKHKAMQKSYDVVDRQQHMLAKGIEKLKQQRNEVVSENNYYKHQLHFYRYASLRPVVNNFKKAEKATEEEARIISAKVDKYEKDLEYLKNVKGIRLGMSPSVEKVMELVEVGQWKFGEGSEEVVWQFLQQVGHEFSKI